MPEFMTTAELRSVLVLCGFCDGELDISVEESESAPYDSDGIGVFTTALVGVTRYECDCLYTDTELLSMAQDQAQSDAELAHERREDR